MNLIHFSGTTFSGPDQLNLTQKKMRFREVTSISGLGGLYKMEVQKPSGVIVTSLTEGWTKFISNRQHLFSPLDNISIYTDNDTVELLEVILAVHENREKFPAPADAKASNDELKAWFANILPNYDREKVYAGDIKKLIKWYQILLEQGVIDTELEEKKKAAEEKENADTKEELPAEKDADKQTEK